MPQAEQCCDDNCVRGARTDDETHIEGIEAAYRRKQSAKQEQYPHDPFEGHLSIQP